MFCTCSCHTYYLRLVFLGVVDHAIKNAMFLNYYNYMINTACSFSNNQSFYCMVCCSTDPSVPPDSSVYNISTTRGTEVTVSLQGLTSGQMYYCKAAATNTNSNNWSSGWRCESVPKLYLHIPFLNQICPLMVSTYFHERVWSIVLCNYLTFFYGMKVHLFQPCHL